MRTCILKAGPRDSLLHLAKSQGFFSSLSITLILFSFQTTKCVTTSFQGQNVRIVKNSSDPFILGKSLDSTILVSGEMPILFIQEVNVTNISGGYNIGNIK